MKKVLLGLVVVFLMVGCSPDTVTVSEVPKEEIGVIKIGGIAALTGEGAAYGEMVRDVANLRAKQINEVGGINGKKIEFVWEDGKCAPADASKAAQKLINMDKVSVILGGVCSGETLGAAPITEKKKVLLFSTVSSSPEVTEAGDFVFRVAPNDNSAGEIYAAYANKNFKSIGIIAEQSDYAVALTNVFEKNYTGTVEKETYLATESDFKTRITKLKASDVEALLVITQTPAKVDIILKQLAEQNWDRPLLMNEMLASNPDIARKYAELLTSVTNVATNFIAPESEAFDTFKEQYLAEYGKELPYQNYAATTLDGVDILFDLFKTIDVSDTEALRDALYATKDYPGIFGNISFDENGDVNIGHVLLTFDGEKFVLYEE